MYYSNNIHRGGLGGFGRNVRNWKSRGWFSEFSDKMSNKTGYAINPPNPNKPNIATIFITITATIISPTLRPQ